MQALYTTHVLSFSRCRMPFLSKHVLGLKSFNTLCRHCIKHDWLFLSSCNGRVRICTLAYFWIFRLFLHLVVRKPRQTIVYDHFCISRTKIKFWPTVSLIRPPRASKLVSLDSQEKFLGVISDRFRDMSVWNLTTDSREVRDPLHLFRPPPPSPPPST